jgi:hypothetical protein
VAWLKQLYRLCRCSEIPKPHWTLCWCSRQELIVG